MRDSCFIVAGGPSLKDFDWRRLDGRFVIAINRSYEVLPEAQVVYFTDASFWNKHKEALLKHKGLLIRGAIHPEKEEQHPRLMYFELPRKLGYETAPGKLCHGSNSGYAAINLAANVLNFKQIYLLGYDMDVPEGGQTHWHSGHGKKLNAQSMHGFAKNFDHLVDPLKRIGVRVYNLNNPDSKLTAFTKVIGWNLE